MPTAAIKPPRTTRRRKIDPTTCDRDYGSDELEFMRALEQYKRSSGRPFPTCSEVLEVLKSLGYTRNPAECPA
jgi:hypothetical protein